jgi:hypothetical protein
LVLRPLFGLLYEPQMKDDDCEAMDEVRIGRKNRSTRRKPAPVPLGSSQIPHYLIRARTRAAAVGSLCLTAWAMVRPFEMYLETLLSKTKSTDRPDRLRNRQQSRKIKRSSSSKQAIIRESPAYSLQAILIQQLRRNVRRV